MLNETSVSIRLYNAFLQLDNKDPVVVNTAYKELYSYIHRAVYRYCDKYYKTTSPLIVEEIVLESFMLVKTKLDQLKNPSAFAGFITGKIMHAAKTIYRKFDLAKVMNESDEKLSLAMELQYSNPNEAPAIYTEINEEIDIIQEAINRLPDRRMRDIIHLRYTEGMKYEKISKILKISENNAKVLSSRAIKNLREDKTLAGYFRNNYLSN